MKRVRDRAQRVKNRENTVIKYDETRENARFSNTSFYTPDRGQVFAPQSRWQAYPGSRVVGVLYTCLLSV
jgi:hypothetical protein